MTLFWKLIMKIIGWKIEGGLPENEKKLVIIVVPHTSNWDFLLGVVIRGSMGFKANFLGKDSLFRGPLGFFFRSLGGIPVNRNASQNMVEQVVDEAAKRESFILAIAPEGTRGKVKKWRTGFYYIALKAGLPIIMCQLDFEYKTARFLEPFNPTGNAEEDLRYIKGRFENIKGLADI
jgi:1-acyl-sn-glycerol-3-phosphate acyltransferase